MTCPHQQILGQPLALNSYAQQNGGFPKLGVPFWGSDKRDHSILGSLLGSPILGNYQIGLPNIAGACTFFCAFMRCESLWVMGPWMLCVMGPWMLRHSSSLHNSSLFATTWPGPQCGLLVLLLDRCAAQRQSRCFQGKIGV